MEDYKYKPSLLAQTSYVFAKVYHENELAGIENPAVK